MLNFSSWKLEIKETKTVNVVRTLISIRPVEIYFQREADRNNLYVTSNAEKDKAVVKLLTWKKKIDPI